MECWHCNTKLIWGGDNDYDGPEFDMVTNLTCPACEAYVEVYLPGEEIET